MKRMLFIIGLLFIFPLNSLAYSINTQQINSDIANLLEELEQDWPSGLDAGRIEVVRQAALMIGKGTIYVYGGGHNGQCATGVPYSLDCSGYVSLAFHRAMVNDVVCGWTTENFNKSQDFYTINESDLRPGDIGLNDSGNGVHVGIYVGKKDGNNIWFHSSKNSSASGPQVRVGNGWFRHFRSYAHWNEIHVSNSSFSTPNQGIGGELGGRLSDVYPNISPLSQNNYDCQTIFYNVDNGVLEESTLKKVLNGIFNLILIFTPVLAIGLSLMDYAKIITNSSDGLKKANLRMIKRITIAILVMFLPFLLEMLFNIFGLYDLSNCGIY